MWKANIPHTHLAHEKSDQNWMVVKGERIEFPGGGTHFHYGADKYIASIANVRYLAYVNPSKKHEKHDTFSKFLTYLAFTMWNDCSFWNFTILL